MTKTEAQLTYRAIRTTNKQTKEGGERHIVSLESSASKSGLEFSEAGKADDARTDTRH